MKKTLLVLASAIVPLIAISVPHWCNDEHLRHAFEERGLQTPAGRITDDEQTTPWWGVEFSDFTDTAFENAYLTPEERRIVRIRLDAMPALTVGFHIEVTVYAANDGVIVEPNLSSARVRIGKQENVPLKLDTNSSREARDTYLGRLYLHRIVYQIDNETIEALDIKTGDSFAGDISFTVDGEPYRYSFKSVLRHEKRPRSCFGVPGTP